MADVLPTIIPPPAAAPGGDTGQPPGPRRATPAEVASLLGVGRLARHVLVCAGPSCCDADEGGRVWGLFKRRLSQLGLTGNDADCGGERSPAVYRTRCDCLRMCNDGPIVVVYPEGAWYERVDCAAAERIVREHVVGGRIVEDYCFAVNPLPGGDLRPRLQPPCSAEAASADPPGEG